MSDYEFPENMRAYRGNSMVGTFRPGDRLIVEPVSIADVRPGDVVVYTNSASEDEQDAVTHRVVAVLPEGLITRGDNNPGVDTERVTAETLLGRVTHVDRDGRRPRRVLGGRPGQLWAGILRARRRAYRLLAWAGRRPYRWLRARLFLRRFWRPGVTKIRLQTNNGVLVKYLHHGRVVARWWPGRRRFECRKPYDLAIPRPTTEEV